MAVKDARTTSSTIGLKDLVVAELISDTEAGVTYDELQKVAGAIDAEISPENSDPDISYADDIEFDVVYPDPEITLKLTLADLPIAIQEMLFSNTVDDNGVLIRSADDKPKYFAVGFRSEKSNHTFRYVWLYKCRAKPITEKYGTKEGTTINSQTPEVELTAVKSTYDGRYQAVADEGENGFTAEKAATFLTSVYTPVVTASGT